MVFTSLEILALIVSVFSIVKILFILFNKKAWFNFAKSLYTNKAITWVFGVLALIVLYYLLQSMTIIQIFAVVAFVAMIMGMAFASYGSEFIKIGEKMVKNGLNASLWVNVIIWLVLSIWVLYILFM